jgi:hypothetical protein
MVQGEGRNNLTPSLPSPLEGEGEGGGTLSHLNAQLFFDPPNEDRVAWLVQAI